MGMANDMDEELISVLDDIEKVIDELMEELGEDGIDIEEVAKDPRKQNKILAMLTPKFARGDIRMSFSEEGKYLKREIHVKATPAAMVMAAYCLIDGMLLQSPGLTFEDATEMMRFIKEWEDRAKKREEENGNG